MASSKLKTQMAETGKWGEFNVIRQSFKDQGMKPSEARDAALREVGCAEFIPGPGHGRSKAAVAKVSNVVREVEEPEPEPESELFPSFELEADAESEVKAEVEVSEKEERVYTVPGKPSKSKDEVKIYSWMFAGKKSNPRKDAEFVFNNMDVDDVKPEDAPSAGAWSYLLRCRANTAIMQDFYRTVWPKLLPTKSQLDELVGRLGDGKDPMLSVIGKVREAGAKSVS